jgi:hypothetical protein
MGFFNALNRGDSMGFTRKRKSYKLDFSGTEFDGLVVKVDGLTTGEYLDFIMMTATVDADENQTSNMIKMLATHLEEDGEPVPPTLEGLRANDLQMNMAIINAWTSAMSNVPEETAKKSETGESPLLGSIPMETL